MPSTVKADRDGSKLKKPLTPVKLLLPSSKSHVTLSCTARSVDVSASNTMGIEIGSDSDTSEAKNFASSFNGSPNDNPSTSKVKSIEPSSLSGKSESCIGSLSKVVAIPVFVDTSTI